MTKFKRLLTAFGIISLGVLSSCSSIASSTPSDKDTGDGTQSLNFEQADLIASLTENEKYLNSDYVQKLSGLQDDDSVHLIITMSRESLSDLYENEKKDEYASLTDFAESQEGINYSKSLLSAQKSLIKKLQEKKLIDGVSHHYTTLLNGFAVETTYGMVEDIETFNRVSDVAVSEAYSLPQTVSGVQSVTENVVDVYDTGIFDSSNVAFDGSNTAVAILDSGFDTHHTVFQNIPDAEDQLIKRSNIEAIIENSVAASLTDGLRASDVYVNGKIPFAYDYADHDNIVDPLASEHGTHVGGIIAGKDDTVTGVATNAQLVLLKVFSDFYEGAYTDDILAGLEDAVLLQVDAINMSLGSPCGFTRLTDADYLNEVYDSIEKAGISLLVAASNTFSSGYGSAGGNSNRVTNPDSATVGSPSTYGPALSVASISGTKASYVTDGDGYTFFYLEANRLGGTPYSFIDMLNLPAEGEKTFEYVTVPGNGLNVNYSSIDVQGKIALVRRGNNTFQEKARIAYENGAIGCIIYNNVSGDINMNAGNDLKLALCSISKDDGEVLASKRTGTLTFSRENLAGPFMSDFSSWGPNPDLTLKPEITAHGGNILSAIPGDKYDSLSGTSMASPNMCGAIVLIRQYVKEKFPSMEATDVNALSMQLLMSTASIALDEVGNPYSPRKQGAGLASLLDATTTNGYITVDDLNKSKLELGDDPDETGVYTLEYNIVNMGTTELKYTIGNETMTESVSTSDSDYVAERANMLNPTQTISVTGDGSADGNTVTVSGNGILKVTQTLTLNAEEKRMIKEAFPNGMFVEGYTLLSDETSNDIDLNAPFLAFFGDWTKAPMFDRTFYEVESEAYNDAIDPEDKITADYYATTPFGTYYTNYIIPLGSYLYEMDAGYTRIPATEEHASISTDTTAINGITSVYAGMLRNGKTVTSTITDNTTGKVVYEYVNHDQTKSFSNGGSPVPSYDMLNILIQDLGLTNNTTYTFTMTALLDYGDGGIDTNLNNTFSFTFTCDNEVPVLTGTTFESEYDRSSRSYRYYLNLDIYDNHYAMCVRPFILSNGYVVTLSSNPIPVYANGRGQTSSVRIEITDYMDMFKYGSGLNGEVITNGIGLMIEDYALNSSYYFANLPGTDISSSGSISFVDITSGESIEALTITEGDEIDLTSYLTSTDPTFATLTDYEKTQYFSALSWNSSNRNVVAISGGQIEALSSGYSIISVGWLTNNGALRTTTLRITVNAKSASLRNIKRAATAVTDLDFTYFDTLFAFPDGPEISEIGSTGERNFVSSYPGAIEFYPSEQIQMYYEVKPWNLANYELTWVSSNPNIISVDKDGIVTAEARGSATLTLRISVNGVQSNILASQRFTVLDPFIVEGTTLVGYKGPGGEVSIPTNLSISTIDDYAFALYITDRTIIVDESDWDANKIPQGNSSIEKVNIPATVTSIGKYAFYNCTALEEVNFEITASIHENINQLGAYTFANCPKLETINLETVSIIGRNCFENCTSLAQANLNDIYSIAAEAFKGCTSLQTVDITKLRNAGEGIFKDCTGMTSFTSGQYTKLSKEMFANTALTDIEIFTDRIPEGCFRDCEKLARVRVVNSLIFVGEEAFANDPLLATVNFENSVEYFANAAFEDCIALTTFTLPSSNIDLEDDVFSGCTSLQTLAFAINTFVENLGTSVLPSTVNKFEVAEGNTHYSVNPAGTILKSADGTVLYLVTPSSSLTSIDAAYIGTGVTTIASGAFSGQRSLVTADLSGLTSLTTIGNNAFQGCIELANVTLPSSLTTIGNRAFYATALSSITLPTSLDTIGAYAFAYTELTEISIPDDVTIGQCAFEGTELVTLTLGDDVEVLDFAFADITTLESVNFGSNGGVTVADYAFSGCTALSYFDFSKLSGDIGYEAFSGDTSIASVNLANVTSIGAYAFASSITSSLTLGTTVEEIYDYAFSGSRFSALTIPAGVTYVGDYAFANNTSLNSITNNSTLLTEFGIGAFANCTNLTTARLNNNITYISENLFQNCSRLTTVTISNVETIDDRAFSNCSRLSTINLTSVISIGYAAFGNCSNLASLNLSNVEYIGDYAFIDNSKVTTISMPKVKSIGAQALSGLNVATIAIPNTIEYIAPAAFYNNLAQTRFTTSGTSDYILIENGVLYVRLDTGKFALNSYPASKTGESFVMNDEATYIQLYAASNNRYLRNITLSNALKAIAIGAFANCNNITSVTFRSTNAPILESVGVSVVTNNGPTIPLPSNEYSSMIPLTVLETTISALYNTSSEIYRILNRYYNLNGSTPLGYNNFVNYVGTVGQFSISVPSNYVESSYNSIAYNVYFDMENITEIEETLNQNSLAYLDAVSALPTTVTLANEDAILDAITYRNALDQNIAAFGYSAPYIADLSDKLDKCYADFVKLKQEQLSKDYSYLVSDINALGSTFSVTKLDEYLAILTAYNKINENERQYFDTTVLDSFTAGYNAYIAALNNKVSNVDKASSVGNIALIAVASILGIIAMSGIAIVATKGKKFGGASL